MEARQSKQLGACPLHSRAYKALLRSGPRLKLLQQVHTQLVVSGIHRSLPLATKLITLVCTAGSVTYARGIFFSIPNPDSFLYSSLITACSKSNFSGDVVLFYHQMLDSSLWPSNYNLTAVIKACAKLSVLRLGEVVHCHALITGYSLDSFVQAALVSFYAKCGDLGTARRVFDKMPERSIIAWNSIISGYEQNGYAEEAIGLFHRMRDSGLEFDLATLVSVLSASSQVGALELGCWVHDYIITNGVYLNVVLSTALINMYARCGNVCKARQVFDSMSDRNVIAWTAMISGYGMHGYGREAMEMFQTMKSNGQLPNDVTFVAVLSACAHVGLVHEGREAFSSMKLDYGLKPGIEHHVCLVDMLGRAGLLNEAFEHIKQLNLSNHGGALWTALLGACKMHKNTSLGVQVAEHLLAAEPDNPGHYVLLSNVYALAGMMDRVEVVRDTMIQKGLRKQVGYSTVEVNQKTYLFSNGDKSHTDTIAIFQNLDKLMQRIGEAGYLPISESVMHEVEEEEKEFALRYHSEKLAISFGILNTSPGTTIRIVKNLRMCEDCHSAIKFISVVADRDIVVRDKHRFHHFKNGKCSCVDYW